MFKKSIICLVIISILMLSGCLIEGRVVDENGAGIAGVKMTLIGNWLEEDKETTTDSDGHYQFGKIEEPLPLGLYSVMPVKSGYAFTPFSSNLEIEGDHNELHIPCTGVDFVGKEVRRYYVFKIQGTGYRKMWGGWAEKMTGYDFRYRHIYPSEVNDVKSWLGNFEEATKASCEAGPPICPCPPYPDIWEVGEIEVVAVFDTYEEVEAAYRCDNPHYMGFTFLCNMWTSESDETFGAEITKICGN